MPHSDIHGSTPARGSPWLFAACHVLHRLLVPRHPPNALLLLSATRSLRLAPRTSHLAQEPSNPSFNVQDLSPSTCRLIPGSCENNHLTETDAPSSTSILFTPLNTSGCGDLVFAHLLRSDLQPARPDAPNPDSHVKRTKPAFLRRPATSARPSPGYLTRGSAQCSHDLLSHRDGVSPTRAKLLMEVDGIEPTTPCLQSRCSPTELHPQETHSE